ncbi:calcium-binding protein [Amaricoccus solimangrovi]|uniref:Calcium-binding protein n=1 Tax=Amaricoccus solimangrovi TaxID=2589815 RepID=A0A501WGT8_9RHOB|nr:calcium-binding protein [Amaricoccus solimangrovi]TPE47695.1 calcium-binding protein [Amaricoccus solimangrovi]
MATYVLTSGDDYLAGTPDADVFDGISSDGTPGAAGGIDMLSGAGGDDDFLLAPGYGDGGAIDGGAGFDRVYLRGDTLGALAFANVEHLLVESYEVALRIDQLSAFAAITLPSGGNIYLTGPGGPIDFSGRVTGTTGVAVNATTLSSGYDVTGTGHADSFANTRHDDVVRGGAGNDRFVGVYRDDASGGADALYGGNGADTFEVRRQDGTIDGGGGDDVVVAAAFQLYSWSPYRGTGDLGDLTFSNVERLVVMSWGVTFATLEQLNAFARITGGNDTGQIMFRVDGAGGSIDFSTRLLLSNERVWLSAVDATSGVGVTGTANADTLVGSGYADTLTGGAGDDDLGGGGGGGDGADLMNGGDGDDDYTADATDTLIDSAGIDTIFAAATFDLRRGPRLQGDFENLTLYHGSGGSADSDGYGNALANVMTGTGGDNTLDGRAGADEMIGGDGDDVYVVDNAGDRVVEQEAGDHGHDTVMSRVAFDLANPDQAAGLLEDLVLTGAGDIRGLGNDLDNILTGNAGANVLDGRGGADTMAGGAGDDRYHVDDAGDQVGEASGGGFDRVFSTVTFSLAGGQAENLALRGSAAINATGNGLANVLTGNPGDNLLNGGGGDDTLGGAAGNDRLNGGAGADTLNGGIGDDMLNGGGGPDALNGGAGLDVFRFNSALGAVDAIIGFNAAADTIEIAKAVMPMLTAKGVLASGLFAANATGSARDADDFILYDTSRGELSYDADGDGAGAAVVFAALSGAPTLTSADLVVI